MEKFKENTCERNNKQYIYASK